MALNFSTSTKVNYEVVVSCDESLDMTSEEISTYLLKGGDFKSKEGSEPTLFVIKALSPSEREEAEVKAGAYKRSELGRVLYAEEPKGDSKEKGLWFDALSDQEKQALFDYNQYINRVYSEMVKAAVIEIKGVEGSPWDLINSIKPESHRVRTISDLVLHIQRVSLLGDQGK